MNSSYPQNGKPHLRHERDPRRFIHQLTWSIVNRCFVWGVVVFFVTLLGTNLPFGMGGSDYLFATLVGGAAAALVGLLAGSLVFLNMQLAKMTDTRITESRRFGLWLHRLFARKRSR